MITRERCPKCGRGGVRRSASIVSHLGRVLNRSKRRFCPSCGERWRHEPPVARQLLKTEELLFAGFVAAATLIVAVATHPHFLKNLIDAQVRSYDETYDAEGKRPLLRNFTQFFRPNDRPPVRYPVQLDKKKVEPN